ncbi:MAG: HU family DNA-binding protein [Phycisphaerales bacterium]
MPKKKTTRKKTTRKAPARKAPTRKTTTRAAASRTTRKKTAAPARRSTVKAADRPRTKSQIFGDISTETGLSKKEVQSVFDTMTELIQKDLGTRGPGQFTVPGLLKITKKAVPRKAAQKNKWIPLLKEFRDIPAKPAHKKVTVRALKSLKEMV